jgi:phospholipid/cholesterol/gamma-HCH transport system substrate-binding protein
VVAENQQSVTNSLHNVEAFTATLARNSERIDDIMGKVDAVMGKADGVVAKTDNIMLGLDTLAGGREGGELFQTVKSIRELAEDFDRRSGALIADGRRTLGDISRAVNNLDRNPTRLLFGAGNSNSNSNAAPAPTEKKKP